MEVTEKGGHRGETWAVEHKECCNVLEKLQRFDHGGRETSQERGAVVKAGDDERFHQELSCFPLEKGPDPGDVVKRKSAGSRHHSAVRGAD